MTVMSYLLLVKFTRKNLTYNGGALIVFYGKINKKIKGNTVGSLTQVQKSIIIGLLISSMEYKIEL